MRLAEPRGGRVRSPGHRRTGSFAVRCARSPRGIHWSFLAALAAWGCGDSRPSTTVLSDAAGTCAINVEEVAELSGEHVNAGIVRMSGSAIYLEDRYQIAVFDLNGRFKRYLGGEGPGPGEFTRIDDILLLSEDRLAVFEAMPPRLTMIDTAGAVLGTALLPTMIWRDGAFALPASASYLLGGMMTSFSHFGNPLVLVDSVGTVVRYFGDNEVEREGFARNRMIPRIFDYDAEVGIVAVKQHKYVVERWNLADGTLAATFSRQVEWFGDQPEPPDPDNPHIVGAPENVFRGLDIDREGRAWLVAQVADEEWEEGVRSGVVVDREAWTDTFIEVLGLGSTTVLCSVRFDRRVLTGFARDQHLATYREDAQGNPTITIWRLSLVPGQPPRGM